MDNEKGASVIEVLVSTLLLSVMGLGLITSNVAFIKAREVAVRNNTAMQLASDAIEQFAGQDATTLSDANDITETFTRNSLDYTRTTDITVNADNSRTVSVTVSANTGDIGGDASISIRLIGWGSA